MKRIQLYAAGVAVAVVPAVIGLTGNASFSQVVPLRSPTSGGVDGPAHDVSDDRATGVDDGPSTTRPTPAATPSPRAARTAEAGDDRGRHRGATGRGGADDGPHHDAGDDHGGTRDRSGSSVSGSGISGRGGADDGPTHDLGDDHSGTRDRSASSGSSGSVSGGSGGSDDGGSGGHGSDD